MGVMILSIEEPHSRELEALIPTAHVVNAVENPALLGAINNLLGAPAPTTAAAPPDPASEQFVLYDRTRQLGNFVRQCIGTFRMLEAHQRGGGALFLGYADGSVREMRVIETGNPWELIGEASRHSPEVSSGWWRRLQRWRRGQDRGRKP
jgi:hypothetical protein